MKNLFLLIVVSLILTISSIPTLAMNMLLVVGDKTDPSDASLIAAIDASKKKYDLYELKTEGPLSPQKIFQYDGGLIIRAQSSEKYMIGAKEADIMWEFMLSQGMLFLFGNKFQPGVDETEFKTVLLSKPNGSAKVSQLKGIQFDLISHEMNLTMKNKVYDGLTPVDPQDRAEPVFALSGDKYAAVKGQTCSYRLLFTTFQPGDVIKQEELNHFVMKSLEWFLGNQMGIGQIAPDSEVQNLNGRNEGLYMHMPSNDIVIVEFFATWCEYCKEEKPILAELKKEYKDKLGILGISYKEKLDVVNNYLKDEENSNVTWEVIIDKLGLASKKYGVKALPSLFLLDKERRVHYIGNFTTKETLINEIEKLNKNVETKVKVNTLNNK